MRLRLLAIFIFAALLLNGCGPSTAGTTSLPTSAQISTSTKASMQPQATETLHPLICYKTPESLDELVRNSKNIIIARTEKNLPAVRVNVNEDTSASAHAFYQNLTPMQVTVLKTIKGSIPEKAALQIAQYGGTAEGITEIYDNLVPLEEGKTYLLFIPGGNSDTPYSCRLSVPYYSNPQIVNGKLEDYAENAFHLPSGMTEDEAVQKIAETVTKPVLYSSLRFGYSREVKYPYAKTNTDTACLRAFSEDMLSESAIVIRGTVTDVVFKNYMKYTVTALYSIRIDRIFYSKLGYKQGDTILVEQPVYLGYMNIDEFGLQPGGQYILPIRKDTGMVSESQTNGDDLVANLQSLYMLLYPYFPMIQVTQDYGYLFYGDTNHGGNGWKSLVNSLTAPVVMDVANVKGEGSYIDGMKLRYDGDFEKDFQMLVNRFCSN